MSDSAGEPNTIDSFGQCNIPYVNYLRRIIPSSSPATDSQPPHARRLPVIPAPTSALSESEPRGRHPRKISINTYPCGVKNG
ncbi:hypothetical protein [uncultured Parabacteroides sp.]|uniref:hypothetical protein n=1 Tax=uncultured Parabacteroides sp. TaxID=512312 RepID=UPI0026756085|nr:hypothetical protein [uncultured Parabacteroides sp.]